MPDTITAARLNRIATELQTLQRDLPPHYEGERDLNTQLQTLTGLVLDLALAVRTIAARNP